MEFGVWSVECGVWSVEFGVWSVECGVWSVECGVWSVEWPFSGDTQSYIFSGNRFGLLLPCVVNPLSPAVEHDAVAPRFAG